MIRELPSLLAGCGALLLFGVVLTGARSPQDAEQMYFGRMEASAISVPDHTFYEGPLPGQSSQDASSLAWNR